MDERELLNVLDGYVTERNNLRREQASGLFKPRKQSEYMKMFAGHASRLGAVLPILSDIQLEALGELSMSLLNERRMTNGV